MKEKTQKILDAVQSKNAQFYDFCFIEETINGFLEEADSVRVSNKNFVIGIENYEFQFKMGEKVVLLNKNNTCEHSYYILESVSEDVQGLLYKRT